MHIDARKFDRIAREVFAPVYPVIASQIIARTGITKGACLDIGCGGGYLGAALARISELFVHLLDASGDMLAIAARTITENGLKARAATLRGDVAAIPLRDASIDLVVSRGSIFFWEDLAQAFREIHRVLTPDGRAYVGGGFGTRQLKESIEREMKHRNRGSDQFQERVTRNLGVESRKRFETALENAGIHDATLLHDDEIGLWVLMRK